MRQAQIAVVVVCLGVLAGCTMWGRQKKDWSGATSGEQLERLWWQNVKSKHFEELERRVAASFLGTNAEAVLDRAALMQHWRQLAVADYTLGDFVSQANGADLNVAYRASFYGVQGDEPARWRMLSVWQETRYGWVLTAQSITPDAGK